MILSFRLNLTGYCIISKKNLSNLNHIKDNTPFVLIPVSCNAVAFDYRLYCFPHTIGQSGFSLGNTSVHCHIRNNMAQFAKAQMEEGKDLVAATLTAVRMRLRPILMTSLAFGFGVLPLAIATGAGAGSQNAIGTGVLGGTVAATVLGIFFVPLFYVVIKRVFPDKPKDEAVAPVAQEGR